MFEYQNIDFPKANCSFQRNSHLYLSHLITPTVYCGRDELILLRCDMLKFKRMVP